MPYLLSSLPFEISATAFAFAIGVMIAAGIVKGTIGFALPLLFLGGLSVVLPIQAVVALIAIPALATNFLQAQRNRNAGGLRDASRNSGCSTSSCLRQRSSATRLVVSLPERALILILGIGAFTLALLQAFEWPREIPRNGGNSLKFPMGWLLASSVACLVFGEPPSCRISWRCECQRKNSCGRPGSPG